MKIYLCSRYSRRDQLRDVRGQLALLGHTVTSRWLDTGWEQSAPSESSAAPPDRREEFAVKDIEDVTAAECLIAFTEPPESAGGRGGRHVELGVAIALGKRLIVVGYRENIFCHLPQVEFFASQWDMLRALERERP